MRVTFLAMHGMGMSSDDGEVRLAGRSVEVLRNGRVTKTIALGTMRLAPYVYSGSGRLGSVVVFEGEGGTFRIASHGHSFGEERYDAEGTAHADAWCESTDEIDALVREIDAALGPPAPEVAGDAYRTAEKAPSHAFVIELLRNPHGAASLRMALAVGGTAIGTLGVFLAVLVGLRGTRAPVDEWLVIALVCAIVAAALAYVKTKAPRLQLRVDGPSAVLLDASGAEIGRVDDPRASLRVSTWTLMSRYGSSTGPRVDLRFGAREISFGCLGPYASGPSGRAPDRLVGPADFARIQKAWGF